MRLDSSKFSKVDLDAIVNAFYDIADVIDTNDLVDGCGVTDATSACWSVAGSTANFAVAKNAVYHQQD